MILLLVCTLEALIGKHINTGIIFVGGSPKMKDSMQTPHLISRRFNQGDLKDLFAYVSVECVGEKAGWPNHKSINESQLILDRFIKEGEVWAIVHRADKRVMY
jgi:hypothetical protein